MKLIKATKTFSTSVHHILDADDIKRELAIELARSLLNSNLLTCKRKDLLLESTVEYTTEFYILTPNEFYFLKNKLDQLSGTMLELIGKILVKTQKNECKQG